MMLLRAARRVKGPAMWQGEDDIIIVHEPECTNGVHAGEVTMCKRHHYYENNNNGPPPAPGCSAVVVSGSIADCRAL